MFQVWRCEIPVGTALAGCRHIVDGKQLFHVKVGVRVSYVQPDILYLLLRASSPQAVQCGLLQKPSL